MINLLIKNLHIFIRKYIKKNWGNIKINSIMSHILNIKNYDCNVIFYKNKLHF